MSDSTHQLTASSSDLAAALQLSMRAVQHENVDVRIHALTSLKDMMHSKQVRKHTLIVRQLTVKGLEFKLLVYKFKIIMSLLESKYLNNVSSN